jgi:hypothetical protein
VHMKFEVTVLPVADAERVKAFNQGLGWCLDADTSVDARQRGSSQETASAAAGRYMADVKHIVV